MTQRSRNIYDRIIVYKMYSNEGCTAPKKRPYHLGNRWFVQSTIRARARNIHRIARIISYIGRIIRWSEVNVITLSSVHRFNKSGARCSTNLASLQDNSPTNQLAVSQVADWITRGLLKLADSKFLKIMELLHFICTLNLILTLTLTLSNTGSV